MTNAIAEFITKHWFLTFLIVVVTIKSVVQLVYGILRVPYNGLTINMEQA